MERLNSIGSSSALRRTLFPLGFGGEVMVLLHETWQIFYRHRDVLLEERITALFRAALIEAYVAAGRSWFVTLEDPVTDPDFGTQWGRNDLRFYPPEHHGQSIYFTVECKRLRVMFESGFRHLADEYVREGLQKFVDETYSAGLPCGGMIGYVMDNRVDDAFSRVQSEINSRRSKLKMGQDALRDPSSVLSSCRHSADSLHMRTDGQLTVHHLLVETSPK